MPENVITHRILIGIKRKKLQYCLQKFWYTYTLKNKTDHTLECLAQQCHSLTFLNVQLMHIKNYFGVSRYLKIQW